MVSFLELFNSITAAGDGLFKGLITILGIIFGGTKVWDFVQKFKEGDNKIKEAQINADKEIKTNKDKHRVELEKLQNTVDFQKTEIAYKDNIITDIKRQVEEYKVKKAEQLRINEGKDKEITRLHERLLDCERSKNQN